MVDMNTCREPVAVLVPTLGVMGATGISCALGPEKDARGFAGTASVMFLIIAAMLLGWLGGFI